jgi:hypothetical protein
MLERRNTKKKKEVVSSTLRLPKTLSKEIKHVAIEKNLSMQQTIIRAIVAYCERVERKWTSTRSRRS